MTMKYRVRLQLKNEAVLGIVLLSEGMTKTEAFELMPVLSNAGLQLAAIDVINAQGYVVEDGVPHKKRRS